MADTKISALPASTTPLAGTEVLPIVQSGVTKQVSVANLTAGRAISATQLTLTTGNVIVASGQGIDFSATPGTGTSELFNDYEEGTWTPSFTGWSANPAVANAMYTKIGRTVTLNCIFLNGTTAGGATIGGLPYGVSTTGGAGVSAFTAADPSVQVTGVINNFSSSIANINAVTISGIYWVLTVTYIAS